MQDTVFTWETIEPSTIIPGFHGRFIHSGSMTFALWRIEKGSLLPQHAHPHEQVAYVMEGELELTVAGTTTTLTPGMVAIVPPHAPHSGRALSECRVLDVFHPRREDYMGQGAQSFLRDAMDRSA
jgi:unsaturated pyranuronate lyase